MDVRVNELLEEEAAVDEEGEGEPRGGLERERERDARGMLSGMLGVVRGGRRWAGDGGKEKEPT
jgi:hypothetical protein